MAPSVLFAFQAVAHTPHRLNRNGGFNMRELLAQKGYVYLHVIILCIGLIAPDLFDQRFLAQYNTAIAQQKLHHIELLESQLDGLLAAEQLIGGEIEGNVTEGQCILHDRMLMERIRASSSSVKKGLVI